MFSIASFNRGLVILLFSRALIGALALPAVHISGKLNNSIGLLFPIVVRHAPFYQTRLSFVSELNFGVISASIRMSECLIIKLFGRLDLLLLCANEHPQPRNNKLNNSSADAWRGLGLWGGVKSGSCSSSAQCCRG